jgi:hypothetical protein
MCISKRIKWIKKKSHREKLFFCIFLQYPHQIDMRNFVECQKEFFAYFDALETYSVKIAITVRILETLHYGQRGGQNKMASGCMLLTMKSMCQNTSFNEKRPELIQETSRTMFFKARSKIFLEFR